MTAGTGLGRHHPPDRAKTAATLARYLSITLDAVEANDDSLVYPINVDLTYLADDELREVLAAALETTLAVAVSTFGGHAGARRWIEVMAMQAAADLTAYDSEQERPA